MTDFADLDMEKALAMARIAINNDGEIPVVADDELHWSGETYSDGSETNVEAFDAQQSHYYETGQSLTAYVDGAKKIVDRIEAHRRNVFVAMPPKYRKKKTAEWKILDRIVQDAYVDINVHQLNALAHQLRIVDVEPWNATEADILKQRTDQARSGAIASLAKHIIELHKQEA